MTITTIFNFIIECLNIVLEDTQMFLAWSLPFLMALYVTIKYRSPISALIALGMLPFLLYFLWAITGLWKFHETATAFNRSAQVIHIGIWVTFIIVGMKRRK